MAKAAKKAAPKKRAAKKSSETEAPAIKMPSTKLLNTLLASARSAYADQREISGTLGAEIKKASDENNLHKKAFASVKAADRMTPEKLADYFAHRDHYEEVLGLRKRAGSVIRMNFDDDGQGGDESEGDDKKTSNIKPFPSPMGVAAE